MNKKQKNDYEAIGKMVASIYESGYLDNLQSYKTSFLKGLASGVGGVIGATIVVSLLVWILSLFHSIPLLKSFTDRARNTIQESKTK